MASEIKYAELEADRERLGRIDTVGRVAQVLRSRILQGDIPPGARLSEESIGHALDVSRNTLREAFRLLGHDGLVVREFNRGAFVRELTVEDLHDLALLRRIVECGAVRELHSAPAGAVDAVIAAADKGYAEARAGNWRAVAVADLEFHQAIGGLAGSSRVNDLMERTLTGYRLAFVVIPAPQELHEPYLERNAAIARLIAAGEAVRAETELHRYLLDAEAHLADAFTQHHH